MRVFLENMRKHIENGVFTQQKLVNAVDLHIFAEFSVLFSLEFFCIFLHSVAKTAQIR